MQVSLMRTVLFLAFCAATVHAAPSPKEVAFFEKEIRPLLAEHCYQCHSSDAKNIKGGLLLDSAVGWQRGGDTGEAILPGEPDNSLLIDAVRYAERDLQMPPKYKLEDDAIAALEKWVALGAPDPREGDQSAPSLAEIDIDSGRDYWAFQKPVFSPGKGSIDAFIGAKLNESGLEPAPLADRTILIRRASFDLVGLPPTPEQVDAFVSDSRSDQDAFAALVDEFLASDGFGERWGRHWLDIVRYGESMGRTRNYPFPYAWRYRDYVIDAFNADKPYNVFVQEQLAGDLLPAKDDAHHDALTVATGFLALGSMDLNENQREQYRMDVVDEQIDVTSRAVLGLTTACARCHDHKFDPIPQSDYYALAGIFRSTKTFSGYASRQGGNRKGFRDDLLVKLDSVSAEVVAKEELAFDPKIQKRLKNQENQLATVNRELRQAINKAKARSNGGKKRKRNKRATQVVLTEKQEAGKSIETLKKRQRELQQEVSKTKRALNQRGNNKKKGKKPKVPRTANYAMGVREQEQPEDCQINIRGEARNLGERVPRGFLQVLSAPGAHELNLSKQSGRLQLAEWMVSPDNPLTARVYVNRLWHHLFGHGLLRTVDNFGEMGERPSHRGLLDHLAVTFMNEGWSTKSMIREIMLSDTYQRQSGHHGKAAQIDPENRLLAHANVRRLQAEPLRDALLAISGRLNRERPDGSPVMRNSIGEMRRAAQLKDEDWLTRRSVYLPIVRGFLPDFLQVFDFAEPSQVMGRRDVTTVSTQALFFMNNPFLMAQARAAADLIFTHEKDPDKRLVAAYRVALGRTPSEDELVASKRFLESASGSKPREQLAGLFQALFASAEFRYLR
jgi:cytochrome c553